MNVGQTSVLFMLFDLVDILQFLVYGYFTYLDNLMFYHFSCNCKWGLFIFSVTDGVVIVQRV